MPASWSPRAPRRSGPRRAEAEDVEPAPVGDLAPDGEKLSVTLRPGAVPPAGGRMPHGEAEPAAAGAEAPHRLPQQYINAAAPARHVGVLVEQRAKRLPAEGHERQVDDVRRGVLREGEA